MLPPVTTCTINGYTVAPDSNGVCPTPPQPNSPEHLCPNGSQSVMGSCALATSPEAGCPYGQTINDTTGNPVCVDICSGGTHMGKGANNLDVCLDNTTGSPTTGTGTTGTGGGTAPTVDMSATNSKLDGIKGSLDGISGAGKGSTASTASTSSTHAAIAPKFYTPNQKTMGESLSGGYNGLKNNTLFTSFSGLFSVAGLSCACPVWHLTDILGSGQSIEVDIFCTPAADKMFLIARAIIHVCAAFMAVRIAMGGWK